MKIEWEKIIIENTILARIIFGAVYVEHWNYMRIQKTSTSNESVLKDLLEEVRKSIDDSLTKSFEK